MSSKIEKKETPLNEQVYKYIYIDQFVLTATNYCLPQGIRQVPIEISIWCKAMMSKVQDGV
jgi:hypothetical protein